MEESSIMQLVSSVVYGALGLVLFIFTLFILEKITHFSINTQIVEEKNTAMALVIASIILSLGMIVSSAIR